MRKSTDMNRRSFICSQVAVAAVAAVGVGGVSQALAARDIWATGTAEDFAKLLDQPFTAITQDGVLLQMTLVNVEAGQSGAARPKSLARAESVSLSFQSDLAEDFSRQGGHIVRVNHAGLGQRELFMDATPQRDGTFEIGLVLN